MKPKENGASFKVIVDGGGSARTATGAVPTYPSEAINERNALTIEEAQVKAKRDSAAKQMEADKEHYLTVKRIYDIEVAELNRLKSEYAERFPQS